MDSQNSLPWVEKADLLGKDVDHVEFCGDKLALNHLDKIEQQNYQIIQLLEHISGTLDDINKNGIASW